MSPSLRRMATLLATTALTWSVAARAAELPSAPGIAQGTVTVGTPAAGAMTITQGSPTAIVNWQSFSIGTGGMVTVRQPSAASTLLNRVTGTTTSTIAGQLNANGIVYLVNPNGILITPTGSVKAGGGFVASTLDIADQDFVAGRRTFRGTGSSKGVTNQGTIEIGPGGYAALIGGTVDNSGIVSVPLGRVGLGAGEQVTIDPSGDGFLQVALPSTGISADTDLIRHSGRISADGGRVEMKAATARDLARNAINLSGVVEARTVSGRSGAIVLGGGAGGRVSVSGKLTASAPAGSKAKGGSVTITGKQIALKGARIDASGDAGGGTVRIGGDYQGTGTLQRAETTLVDAATTIIADGGASGSGGSVVIWSDRYTVFAGSIFARGGVTMGDGGSAEVSSKGVLDYRGMTDLRATNGRIGTLLLDPYDVYIETVSSPNGNTVTSGSFLPSADNSVLDVAILESALATADVVISTRTADGVGGTQAGDIIVGAPVSWSSASTLTLNAQGIVDIGFGFNAPLGSVVINAFSVKNDGVVTGSGGTVTAVSRAGGAGGATLLGLDITANAGGTVFLDGNYAIGSLFNVSGGSVWFGGAVSASVLTLGGSSLTATGAINVGSFLLTSGSWTQIGSLPAFSANDFFSVSPGATFLRALGGDGVTSPYLLTDIYGVMSIGGGSLLNMNFALANDIDATRSSPSGSFGPIGGTFTGVFDGQGHTISNLSIVGSGAAALGMFGVNAGTIRNLSLTGLSVVNQFSSGSDSIGGIAGVNDVSGVITNVRVSVAQVTSDVFGSAASVGGIVGVNLGTITQAAVVGPGTINGLSTNTAAGGLVGINNGTISDSYAQVAIQFGAIVTDGSSPDFPSTTGGAAGGLVGANAGLILNSYSTGAVALPAIAGTASIVGGLVGLDSGGTVSVSFWDSTASGLANSAAGTPLTTAAMQDGAGFVLTASTWDFTNVWSAPAPGRYPGLRGMPSDFVAPPAVTLSQLTTQQLAPASFVGESNPFTEPGQQLSSVIGPVSLTAGDVLVGALLNGGAEGSGGSGGGASSTGGDGSGSSGGDGGSGGSGSGGGPTLGTGQPAPTVETARVTLVAVERGAETFQTRLADCQRSGGAGGYGGCVGDAMSQFAAALDDRALQLPPPLRGISAVIRQAAARVRAARTVGEARAAVRDALSAVRSAIALIKVDDPAVARLQVRQANTIRTALERCDIRLASAGGL